MDGERSPPFRCLCVDTDDPHIGIVYFRKERVMDLEQIMQYEISIQQIIQRPTESMMVFMVATYILGARIFRISNTEGEFGNSSSGSTGMYGILTFLWLLSPAWVPFYYVWGVLSEVGLKISGDPRPKPDES